jgi:hypothetical protein
VTWIPYQNQAQDVDAIHFMELNWYNQEMSTCNERIK